MTRTPQPGEPLARPEVAALAALADGRRNDVAADHLGMSIDGFKYRLRCTFVKLDAVDRAHAVARAFADGYLWVDTRGRIRAAHTHSPAAVLGRAA